MNKSITHKEFIIKKGEEDYKVWVKPNEFIFNFMHKKRKAKYRHRILRKNIRVKVTIIDGDKNV